VLLAAACWLGGSSGLDGWAVLMIGFGEVSGSMLAGMPVYEPESLILAQSERWRNA
jgi:hypothetical protein